MAQTGRFLALFFTWCTHIVVGSSFAPVIGVLSQPLNWDTDGSYIEAWYVNWLEAHGARVVPMRYDAPRDETNALMQRVNGVLFPGGGAGINQVSSAYGRFGSSIFHAAWLARMPFWGTCLGFEQAMLYSSGLPWPGPLTKGWDAEELFLPLNLTVDGASTDLNTSLLADWPADLKHSISERPWTFHMHQRGVSPKAFAESPKLSEAWHVLATSRDRRGQEFISLVQAQEGLPFFASQFHPEKNAHEFEEPENASIDGSLPVHSAGAIEAMGRFGASFVDRARSFRRFGFTKDEFWKWSITKWPMTLAESTKGAEWLPKHMQLFYFPPWNNSATSQTLQLQAHVLV